MGTNAAGDGKESSGDRLDKYMGPAILNRPGKKFGCNPRGRRGWGQSDGGEREDKEAGAGKKE